MEEDRPDIQSPSNSDEEENEMMEIVNTAEGSELSICIHMYFYVTLEINSRF
jgi:hypothetical protein